MKNFGDLQADLGPAQSSLPKNSFWRLLGFVTILQSCTPGLLFRRLDRSPTFEMTLEIGSPLKLVSARGHMVRLAFFISHSAVDTDLASALTRLIQRSLGIEDQEIRCSSVNGFRLPAGAEIIESLKKEVFEAEIVIALLTPDSMRSQWVLFELGARWGSNKLLLPIVARGLEGSARGTPLAALNALNISNRGQLLQFAHECAEKLNITVKSPRTYVADVNKVLELANSIIDRGSLERLCMPLTNMHDDFTLFPIWAPGGDISVAVIDTTNDYSARDSIVFTTTGLIVQFNPSGPIRLNWSEILNSPIRANREEDQVTIGNDLILDLSETELEPTEFANLLRRIAGAIRLKIRDALA